MIDKIKNLPSLLFLLIGIVLAAMIYMQNLAATEGIQAKLTQIEAVIAEKSTNLKKAQNAAQEISTLKSEIERIGQSLSIAETLAPKDLSMRAIIESVSREAKDSGIRVVASKPKEVSSKNFYDEIPMEVEFEGAYSQLTFFMYLLSKQRLILKAKDIEMSVKEILDGKTNIKMRGEIVGFKYKEAPR